MAGFFEPVHTGEQVRPTTLGKTGRPRTTARRMGRRPVSVRNPGCDMNSCRRDPSDYVSATGSGTGPDAEGFDHAPEFDDRQFLETQGVHGYDCARMNVETSAKQHRITKATSGQTAAASPLWDRLVAAETAARLSLPQRRRSRESDMTTILRRACEMISRRGWD
jgi:hypothetical protein